jgi:hypothetical protein
VADVVKRALKGQLLGDIGQVISGCWNRKTSYDPVGWSNRNRAWGQCAVTALIVQDLFGGVVLRGFVDGIEHYWNRLPKKGEVDLTRTQFADVHEIASVTPVSRDYILASPSTAVRYADLKRRVTMKVGLGSGPKMPRRFSRTTVS